MSDEKETIAFPAWFRWTLSLVLPGATLWATFISAEVMKMSDLPRDVEAAKTRAVSNAQDVKVLQVQQEENKRVLIRIEDKMDEALKLLK